MSNNDHTNRFDYLKQIITDIPELPGVYQYYDVNDIIIYVGKAKNLKRRVGQYFSNKVQSSKTIVLVSKIYNIKYIVVDNEEDAFLLENNLIKKYKPRYNILLKDDKTYPWIVIKNEPYPRVFLTRHLVKDGSTYFGPYTSNIQVKAIMDVISNLYPIRTCNLNLSDSELSKYKYKVCLKYHIKKCCGPCEFSISKIEYDSFINDIRNILKGNLSQVIKSYTDLMTTYADNLEFEKAADIKYKLDKLNSYQSRSTVISSSYLNTAVFSYIDDDNSSLCYVNYLNIVKGSVIQSYTIEIKKQLDETPAEILSYAIQEILDKTDNSLSEAIVPFLPDVDFSSLRFTVPIIGEKKRLLELSEKNAKQYKIDKLNRYASRSSDSKDEKMLIVIKESLGLKELPRRIECFDNSNISGAYPVAACVVFNNCRPLKSEYRLYNIKTVEGPNDYASMSEVVFRRYKRIIEENNQLPDLIIADGGIGQMNVIRSVVEDELNLSIPILGLSKDNRHKTNEILFGFPPKVISITKNNQVFKLFTRIQDEVHRFAITFHKKIRSKGMVKSELDNIKGIGVKTKELLLSKYKSVENIKKLDNDELIKLIGASKAKILISYFNNQL